MTTVGLRSGKMPHGVTELRQLAAGKPPREFLTQANGYRTLCYFLAYGLRGMTPRVFCVVRFRSSSHPCTRGFRNKKQRTKN